MADFSNYSMAKNTFFLLQNHFKDAQNLLNETHTGFNVFNVALIQISFYSEHIVALKTYKLQYHVTLNVELFVCLFYSLSDNHISDQSGEKLLEALRICCHLEELQ